MTQLFRQQSGYPKRKCLHSSPPTERLSSSGFPRAAEANFNLRPNYDLMNKRIRIFLFCWASFTIATSGLTIYQPTYNFNLRFTCTGETQLLNIPLAVVAFGIFAIPAVCNQPSHLDP